MTTTSTEMASVRHLVDDVDSAIDFYATHLGFALDLNAAPAFAEVIRGPLRLLLSGPTRAARPMADGAKPAPGGWNRPVRRGSVSIRLTWLRATISPEASTAAWSARCTSNPSKIRAATTRRFS